MNINDIEEGLCYPSDLKQERSLKSEKSFCKSLREYFREYCRNTSIHGVHYLGERRTICEKIWWMLCIFLSLFAAVTFILDTYYKWERAPVIVTFATTEKPIWQIPFPAVTICPETKSNPAKFNYTAMLHKKLDNVTLTPDEEKKFGYLNLVCAYRDDLDYDSKYTEIIDNDDLYDFYHNMTKHLRDMFDIKFMGEVIDETYFTKIITDEGICYSFNILDRSDIYTDLVMQYKDYHEIPNSRSGWSLENGYDITADKDAYPRRALFAGASSSLEIQILIDGNDTDYLCKNGLQGFKVQVHHPAKVPLVKQQYFRIPLDQTVVAAISPKMIDTSEDVRHYSPKKRGCYLPSERKLHFFKVYTQQTCQLECLTNITLDYCDCVNFYMPRDNETHICGVSMLDCMIEAENDLQTNFITAKLNKTKKSKSKSEGDDCDCLPVCTSIQYDVETSQADWDWERQFKAERLITGSTKVDRNLIHFSGLNVFFKTSHFIPSERHELYGPTDFVANFGGLLGLFTGFSLLSLWEIIYFLTVRIVCNVVMYGKRQWSGLEHRK